MTYRNANNDPNRTKAALSPAEVRRMMGGDPAADQHSQPKESAQRLEAIFGAPSAPAPTPAEYEIAQAQSAGRCQTCGRKFDCACGDDCTFCVGGVTVLVERESYAPAGR